jgi:hypothetical protein
LSCYRGKSPPRVHWPVHWPAVWLGRDIAAREADVIDLMPVQIRELETAAAHYLSLGDVGGITAECVPVMPTFAAHLKSSVAPVAGTRVEFCVVFH